MAPLVSRRSLALMVLCGDDDLDAWSRERIAPEAWERLEDIRRETDGPMLRHGLQELHGATLVLPRKADLRPDPERLAARFERFRKAG